MANVKECDWCRNVYYPNLIRTLCIYKPDGTEDESPVDLCVHCAKKLFRYISWHQRVYTMEEPNMYYERKVKMK